MTFKQKNFGQKFIGALLIASLLSPVASFADYRVIYEDVKKTDLSSGVTYEQHLKLTNGGWVYINAMRVDLTNPNVEIKPLYSDTSISKKEKLSTLASNAPNLIGAVNADFFDPKSSSALGQIIDDGELVTTGTSNASMASLNISKDDLAFVEYWKDYGITLANPKMTLPITFKNKPYLDYDRAIIFDHNWAKKSYGNTLGKPIIEMLIVDNRVVNIVENGDPLDIPDNGYVVSAVGKRIDDIKNNFAIDDPVLLDYDVNLKDLAFSIGGGSLMVKDGAAMTTFSNNISGVNPRTAVGITQDRKQLIIITIDGRTRNMRGVNQPELAQILIDLGAYEAINLDGGGSTEMLVKNLGQKSPSIVNFPSDGGERRVHDGIGVISKSESGTLDQLMIQATGTKMLLQSPIDLNLVGLDANRNAVNLDSSLIKWEVISGSGSVENNVLKAKKAGKLTLKASYNDKSTTKDFTVYDEIVDLDIQPKVIQLKSGSSANLTLTAYTASGYTIPVKATSVIWNMPKNLINIDANGVVTPTAKDGKGVLTATIDGVKKNIPIIIGADMTVIDDFSNTANDTFTSYPSLVTGSYTPSADGKDGSTAGMITYDFSATDVTRAAYVNMANGGLIINSLPDKIGLDVFGTYGNNHWLRAKISDSTGKSTTVDLARNINWTGWQYTEASVPRDFVAPIKVEQVYLVEDDPVKRDNGYVLIDNLYTVNEKKNDVVLPKDVDKLPKIENMKITAKTGTKVAVYGEFYGTESIVNYDNYKNIAAKLNKYKNTFFAGTADDTMSKLLGADIQATKYSETVVGSTMIVTMKSVSDSFIKADPLQWEKFLIRVNNFDKYKNLVLVTNHSMNFTDAFEEKLFTEQLEKLKTKGVKTYVLSGGQSNGFDIRYKSSATVVDLQTLNKYSGFDLEKGAGILVMNISGDKVEFQVEPLNFVVKKPTADKRVKAPSSIKFKNIRTASPKK